jgi:hypothetical protein
MHSLHSCCDTLHMNVIIPTCFLNYNLPKMDSFPICVSIKVIIKLTLVKFMSLHPDYILEMISYLTRVTTADFTSLYIL